MTSHARGSRRGYQKSSRRRVWVFSELNHDLRPTQLAKIITVAGLEQARLEAAAQAEAAVRAEPEVGEGKEAPHA